MCVLEEVQQGQREVAAQSVMKYTPLLGLQPELLTACGIFDDVRGDRTSD